MQMGLTKRDLAVLTAYTGRLIGNILDYHRYLDEVIPEGAFNQAETTEEIDEVIRKHSKEDFLKVERKLVEIVEGTDNDENIELLEAAAEEIVYSLNSNKTREVKDIYLANAERFINIVIDNLAEGGTQ